jgi:hypothetical protein
MAQAAGNTVDENALGARQGEYAAAMIEAWPEVFAGAELCRVPCRFVTFGKRKSGFREKAFRKPQGDVFSAELGRARK